MNNRGSIIWWWYWGLVIFVLFIVSAVSEQFDRINARFEKLLRDNPALIR